MIEERQIDAFIGATVESGLSLNGLVIFQNGKMTFEQYWWPHTAETFHTLHSATKSFVGTAVGFAVAENLVRLDYKVMAFFPEFASGNMSEHLAAMTIADLLTMRSGHEFGLSGGEWRLLKTSWVAEFFKAAVTRPPGQSFIYSSASSHILSAIVQRASGTKVRDFLEPRLFGPLDITDLVWDDDPDGISAGGNGLKLKLADFLKWGIVHLQGGIWNGKQTCRVDQSRYPPSCSEHCGIHL